MSARLIPSGRRAAGRLVPPPSKSLSNRYLTLALLSDRPVRIERLLAAEDTAAFLEALERLGWRVERDGEVVELVPDAVPGSAEIWCGASGTMARFAAAALAARKGRWRLDGTARLRQRPLAPLVGALRELGARIDFAASPGFFPLEIRGGGLAGGAVALDAGESSQFASALMMAATRAAAPVEISLSALTSSPYLDLTRVALGVFGGRVERLGPTALRVRPGLPGAARVRVEGDYSSAAYWAAGTALTGGSVELAGLGSDSAQGDRGFLDVLAAMGLGVRWGGDRLTLTGGKALVAVDRDLSTMPDQVPTLAALAPFARGVTRIRNVSHLRIKESDRLAAMAAGLRAAGATVEELADGLVIPGLWAESAPPERPLTVSPVDDHRIAMSFAVFGLRRSGLSVADPGVVAKSYPGFWRDFDRCFRA